MGDPNRRDHAANFVFDEDYPSVVRLIDDQLVCGPDLKLPTYLSNWAHQIGTPSDHARSARIVTDLVGGDIEGVLTVDEVTERLGASLK